MGDYAAPASFVGSVFLARDETQQKPVGLPARQDARVNQR
jgi:hypothetical protein